MTATVSIHSLSFKYDHAPVIDKLTDIFVAGQVHYILGASGSGKTTLALLLSGVLSPSSGSIVRIPDAMPRLVLQFPEQLLLADSVAEEWRLSGRPDSYDLASLSMATFGLSFDEFAERSPRSLSFGQRRLLALALQSAHDTQCLILDEPTLGLDEVNLATTAAWIIQRAKSGTVCLVITHDVELLTILPGVGHVLRGGQISWSGPTEEFIHSPGLQADAGFR